MLIFYRQCIILLWIQYIQTNLIQTSYVRHLSLTSNITHLTYYSKLKWLYVASIDSLSIYDHNLTNIQHISLSKSSLNDDDICRINPCQCIGKTNGDETISNQNRYTKSTDKSNYENNIDKNNYNLMLYLEKTNRINNKTYLIDCWSLEHGSCIIRNAHNLSDIYYNKIQFNQNELSQKVLFNTDSIISNHIFPFHFKFNKCNDTPTYLFLTSTLKKDFILLNNSTDFFYLKCLEQSQRRTIALRSFIYNDAMNNFNDYVNGSMTNTFVKDSIMKQQSYDLKSSINTTRPLPSNNKSNLAAIKTISQSSSIISNNHVMHANFTTTTTSSSSSSSSSSNNNNLSSSYRLTHEQGPFLNLNDYCPEQLSVVRSIYTDFFERESSDKFRIFQDVIYDENDSSIYVFTNQQYTSKIVRLCEGQISFRHYVEVEINCGSEYKLIQKVKLIKYNNDKQYLLAIASKPKSSNSLEPSINSHSAICLYDLNQIRNAFVDNIVDLSKGNVSLGMAWLHGESVIPQYPTPYGNLARCSTVRDASYLMIYEGSTHIHSEPLITFPSDQLTSLEATVINDYIVVLTGTSDGKIKKIRVELIEKKAYQFNELFVHFGESILRDMILDENGRFLYGATKTRLFQIDLYDCDQHKTCLTCLSPQNPYCSWGTLYKRCTTRTNVTDSRQRFSWLQIRDNCPNIIDMTPSVISKSKSTKLKLNVNSIPDDTFSKYSCAFGLASFLNETDSNNAYEPIYISNGIRYQSYIECYSPPPEIILNITHNSLIIYLYYNDIILTERNFTFYDCSSYKTCTSCMNNLYNCLWQLLTSTCTDSDLHIEKNQTITKTFVNQCPRYNVSKDQIFISDNESFAVGEKDQVKIQIFGLKHFIEKYFRCIFILTNGSLIISQANVNNDLLICESIQISYENDLGQQSISFEIEWKECQNECKYKKLEAISNLKVNIYKCKYLADTCGSCILLDDDYQCVWCETDKSCRHQTNSSICLSNHVISSSTGVCPDPRLRQIYPRAGPEYGQTPIQIYGTSLGKKPNDISVVFIHKNESEYQCTIDIQSYTVTQSFICQPPPLPVGIYRIKVTVHSVISKDQPTFEILKPIIRDVYPQIGPRSGGTILSIRGKHLTIGNRINVFIGTHKCYPIENESIQVTKSSNTVFNDENNQLVTSSISSFEAIDDDDEQILKCRTSKLDLLRENENHRQHERLVKREALWIGQITIIIDNFTETYSNITYSYTEDPRVFNLSRYSGIISGGLPILVYGTNFDSIQTPTFFIEHSQSQIFIENCSVKTSDTMICFSPSIKSVPDLVESSSISLFTGLPNSIDSSLSSDENQCFEFKFGFFMDDVAHVRNTSLYKQIFLLCSDPIIYPFNNNGKRVQYLYDYLTIEGSNLLNVATMNDYLITIGPYPCNITSISNKQIVCQPTNHTVENLLRKKRLLSDITGRNDEQAIVRVSVGHRIYTLGKLTYISNVEKRPLALYYIIASICGFLLTMFIIVVSIAFRRINTKRTRQLNRLQNQIDTLEMRVARECKEAFAELQTDIGEITNDLSHSGVPYNDYRTFCMKILFPNATDEEKYMMLHNIEIPLESQKRNNIRQGLQLLSQSLYNRHFLLLLIRTLEKDKINFRLQDRMLFASLISILLQDNIEYFTEILKTLLKELIEKSLQQDKSNSKILLRSNASIVEKMLSNWFALVLFGYIKERLGSPLYILFQSVKQQIQKGPIDYLTNESRYSLSEDKLLRQHIDYVAMVIYVIQIDDEQSQHVSTPVPIKVLSCDSITQVKEKVVDVLYKNIPFSKRPAIEDFDLEWRTGANIKVLRDEENIGHTDSNGFVQIQTLATYKIYDGTRLFLSVKRGLGHTNTSSYSSLLSYQANSNGLNSIHSKSNLYSTKTNDLDNSWQLFQGFENQILLNSTADLINLRRDNRTGNANQSEQNTRFFHLVKSTDREDDDRSLMTNKLVSEVYLTRLLATKGSLQKYIDNFFDTIFCLTDIPSPIKYLFDFLDEQAEYHQILDPTILHSWKSNSLPLRFFVNIIKNPDFVFDVQKTNFIDASLSVIAQMFMDSCAAGTHQLTKDSPSSKLLFYRDVQKYKKLVEKYYDTISSLPTVIMKDLDRTMISIQEQEQQNSSNKRINEFNRTYILFKLYTEFINRHKNNLRFAMINDPYSKQYRLTGLFEQIISFMDSFQCDV